MGLMRFTNRSCARLMKYFIVGGGRAGARMTFLFVGGEADSRYWWISGSRSAFDVERSDVVSSWYQFGSLWSLVALCGYCLLLNKLCWSIAMKRALSSPGFFLNASLSCAQSIHCPSGTLCGGVREEATRTVIGRNSITTAKKMQNRWTNYGCFEIGDR